MCYFVSLLIADLTACRPAFPDLFVDSSARTAAAIFAESTLCRTAVRARFEFFSSGLPRVVTGAIQVGHKSADNKETVEVGGFHGLQGSRRNLLVVHDLRSP